MNCPCSRAGDCCTSPANCKSRRKSNPPTERNTAQHLAQHFRRVARPVKRPASTTTPRRDTPPFSKNCRAESRDMATNKYVSHFSKDTCIKTTKCLLRDTLFVPFFRHFPGVTPPPGTTPQPLPRNMAHHLDKICCATSSRPAPRHGSRGTQIRPLFRPSFAKTLRASRASHAPAGQGPKSRAPSPSVKAAARAAACPG